MRGPVATLWGADRGAVAPTVALSLFALVAVGGLAFDYARMAGLDTELQDAADHAALAAASQLDGRDGACARAASAAANMIQNITLQSNVTLTRAINVQEEADCDSDGVIRFWQDKEKTTAADADSNAKFVEVEVDPRRVNYALTPWSGAFTSGDMKGIAFAGLEEAVCRVPPVMLCNPSEDDDADTDDDFDFEGLYGHGIRLISNNGGPTVGPGNFGFLDVSLDTSGGGGANILRKLLGYDTPPGDCLESTGVTTEPGAMDSVIAALNTRFDIYDNGLNGVGCDPNGNCSSSFNSTKDLVMDKNGANLSCGAASGNAKGWKEFTATTDRYYPTSAATISYTPKAMGHPRDLCHAWSYNGNCSYNGVTPSPIGNGAWDIDAYWRANHGGSNYNQAAMNAAIVAASGYPLPTRTGRQYPTRYQVYLWEIGSGPSGNNLPTDRNFYTGNNRRFHYGRAVCDTSGGNVPGKDSTGADDENVLDRRKLTVAVINCKSYVDDSGQTGINGKEENVPVLKWVDVFLVEPSYRRDGGNRTKVGDVYVEVVGLSSAGGTGETVQLVKKSVPYLIE